MQCVLMGELYYTSYDSTFIKQAATFITAIQVITNQVDQNGLCPHAHKFNDINGTKYEEIGQTI